MRKSFTRLFSLFVLLCGLSLQMALGAPGLTFVGASSIPKDADANVKPTDVATKFVVAFDAVPVITDAGGTIVIYKWDAVASAWALIKTIPLTKTSSNVAVVGKTLEITHGISTFTQGEIYSVSITDNAITGLSTGALASGNYDFTIGDWVAPTLSSTAAAYSPLKGATSVMANLNGAVFSLTIPFSEAVTTAATPGNKAVYVYQEDGTIVDIVKVSSLTVANGLGTANITVPVAVTSIFKENTKYYIRIDEGAFVDVNGNANAFAGLTTPSTWTFTTRDYSAPAITANISDISTTTAKLNVSLTEKGKYYYLLQATTPVDPADPATAAAVKAGGTAVTVGTENTVVPSTLGVAGSTSYEVFVVAENNETTSPNLGSTIKKLTFSTVDVTAPTIISRGKLQNSNNQTYALYMTFNESVKGGAGNLDVRLNSNDSYVKTIAASAVTSTKITTAADATKYGAAINSYVVVLDLGMTLPSKTAYYVTFPDGYIEDTVGNDFVGGGAFISPVNKTDWPLTSYDYELPVVSVAFTTPGSLASTIDITFDEAVSKQTNSGVWADVIALELTDGTPVTFTAVSTPTGTLVGETKITLTPTVALSPNTTYVVRLRPDAVKDATGNAITTEKLYSLTTGDLAPFAVTYGSSLGATTTANLLANSTIQIDFNKAVKVNTTGTTWVAATAENLASVITFKKGTTAKAFTVTYDATTFTATIVPTDALASNANDYVVTIDGSKVRDCASTPALLNTAAGYVASQTYIVKDYEAPVATVSHSGDVTNILANANPTITLTDASMATLADMNGNLLTALPVPGAPTLADHITFKQDGSNGPNLAFTASYAAGVITITPTVALATGKTYYYGIGSSVQDGNNNVTAGKFATFTMKAAAVAPTITAETYTLNSSAETAITSTPLVNVLATTGGVVNVTVTFNDNIKEMDPASPNYVGGCLVADLSVSGGASVATVTIGSANVSGKVLTLAFNTGALASETSYVITLPAKMVQGSSYISGTTTFAQFAGKTITFTAKDINAPIASANTPALAATGIALNTPVTINFSEKVVLGSGNILIKDGTTTVQTIAVNPTNVSLDATGTTATIKKTGDLVKYNTVYTIEVPKTAFTDDISLNQLSAVYSGTFTTVVNPQPGTVSLALSPADNSDQVATSPLTMTMTFDEEVVKYDPSVGTRKLWYLVKQGTGAVRASINASGDLVNAGNDVVVANNYIETASVGISGNIVSIVTGFTPVAGDRYYVLITPGAFLDKSTGTGTVANPVPGVFAGITVDTSWNFTTKDENAGTVTFAYTKRADNLVATTSDIVINFSRPIVNADGSAITDAQVANLFTLTKTAGPGTLGVKAFVGTISADKKTVTILNSSLVTLGEMTQGSSFTIATAGTIKYANGSAIAGCTDSFVTSNYGLPTVAAAIAAPVAHVLKDKATVTFTCNSNTMISTVQTAMSKLYYMIQAGTAVDPAITPAVVKTSALSQSLAGTATLTKTYQFTGLAEETSYVVYTVVEDAAANLSTVATTIFITDDVTKPTLSVKPTAFDANKKLTFTFNEAVSVAGGNLAVRILEKATMKEVAKLNLNAVAGKPTQLITDAFTGLATSNTLVSYYVEIDKGIVNDVAVVTGDATNTFDGLFRTDCEVSSSDVTAPTLSSSTPTFPAVNVNTNFSFVLTFSEAVKKATVIPAAAFQVMQYNPTTLAYDIPYEVIDPANVVTNGTSNVTVTISRTLASTTSYQISVNTAAFTDLNGTVCTSGTATGIITTKDVVSPVVTLTPANAATAVPLASTITIDFNEVIRNLDNSVIDNYDLDSLVYFKKNGVAAAFDAAISNPTGTTSRITITPATALVADASYTFGYKAKFEDASDNAVAAGQSTFSTVTTSPAAQYLTWSPVKKTATPWSALATKGAITLNFTNNIFTYSTTASANNLPVTAAWLASTAINVYENNVLVPTANLVFTVVDNKTFTVAPKTSWSSYAVVKVEINGATLQVNEGNVTVLGTAGVVWDNASFQADDTVKPILDVNKDAAPFTDGYSPVLAAAGVASPVIAKSDFLQLYFTEDVKVGSGTVEIHRWDGVLAKTVVPTVNSTDKKLVTLGSLTDLPTNQEYYVIVNEGALVDVTNSNPFAGITAVKSWRFSLRDDAYPAISTYTPNTTNIPVTTGLTINFDRPIALGTTGYIALYKSAAGGDAVQLMRAADNTPTGPISVSGSSATVALNVLEPNTQYFVEVAGGTFASAVDASKTQATQARSVWSFTTEGTTAPTILATGYAPAQNATGVGLNEDLKITFDMPVEAGSGNIQLHSTDGSIVLNFDVKTQVTFNENVVSIALPVLAQNTQYYVIIPATAIRNRTYTPEYFAGITVPYAWKFNTVTDAVAPTVVATPATGATNQKNTFDVTLTFNETVTGVDATNVKVSKGTVAISTVTAGTVYKATITAEDKAEVVLSLANGIKDAANNALVPVNFTYTVGDNTAPTAVVTPATTGKQPKAFTVTVTFNEAVTGAETGITVTGATTAVVTKTSDAVYAVAITAADNSSIVVAIANTIKDASINANAFVGATYTYTTGDNTAPSIITVNPNGGALANAHPDNFEIYVSEAVVKGTGKLTVYKKSDNSKAMELDAANVTIAAAGTAYKVTIPLTGSLDKNTEYYVNVAEGFVADASGNKLPVVDSKTFWTFKTGDFKTGIDETENSLKVYPNPFVSVVNIDSSADLSKAIVTNLAGQTVKVVANPGNSIDLSELHSGIYFISLYDMDNVIAKTVKLVKK